jgi:hypothetical protein
MDWFCNRVGYIPAMKLQKMISNHLLRILATAVVMSMRKIRGLSIKSNAEERFQEYLTKDIPFLLYLVPRSALMDMYPVQSHFILQLIPLLDYSQLQKVHAQFWTTST